MQTFKSFLQLGPLRSLYYLWYQFKLQTGLLVFQSLVHKLEINHAALPMAIPWPIPSQKAYAKLLGKSQSLLIAEADEILDDEISLYGHLKVPLDVLPPARGHWTEFTDSLPENKDIKNLWELGRFGWATQLARAYHFSQDDQYAEFLWQKFERFSKHNPPNNGPHWSSGQEVALRLIAMAFSYAIIQKAESSTSRRKALLAASIEAHAQRIPISIDYAKAQDNNHLLSEALGLMTAGIMLPKIQQSKAWYAMGRSIFIAAIQSQINADGAYSQHSSNYQRLILQLGLWAQLLCQSIDDPLPDAVLNKLAAATQWQLDLCEKSNGHVANLGPNDGAYILPLSQLPFEDHRPVLQAASATFLGQAAFEVGAWDEMSLWLSSPPKKVLKSDNKTGPLRLAGQHSWAYFRAAKFSNRPGHADQLHLDLWWHGLNLAQDAGSFLYNAPPPWNNALDVSRVHNTVTINEMDQMQKAGRFLWLDWAQANVLEKEVSKKGQIIQAKVSHNGYRALGISHEREVRVDKYDQWEIIDTLSNNGAQKNDHVARLRWLLPDLEWQINEDTLSLQSEFGEIQLRLQSDARQSELSIIRAGEVLHGPAKADPISGWVATTYARKEAALAIILESRSKLPIIFHSRWNFPKSQ